MKTSSNGSTWAALLTAFVVSGCAGQMPAAPSAVAAASSAPGTQVEVSDDTFATSPRVPAATAKPKASTDASPPAGIDKMVQGLLDPINTPQAPLQMTAAPRRTVKVVPRRPDPTPHEANAPHVTASATPPSTAAHFDRVSLGGLVSGNRRPAVNAVDLSLPTAPTTIRHGFATFIPAPPG